MGCDWRGLERDASDRSGDGYRVPERPAREDNHGNEDARQRAGDGNAARLTGSAPSTHKLTLDDNIASR